MPPSLTERLQSLLGTAFRLDRELTGGGMSRVFVAHEPALKREVVVKVLPPDLVTRESVARFEREIAVTAQLQHPHILPVITTGGADDIYYYVAPYIHGESLRARLAKDGKLPFDEAVRLIGELLGAVGFAHARGIIHRDIKPGNILLAEGHAILADFGIARALAGPDDGRLTMTGGAMGTPSYMAPEQPRNEQADLYAVAVVAHEMLTGQLPRARGDIPKTTAEIATAVPRDTSSRAKGVAKVLAQAMAIDSEVRYKTAKEFRGAMEAAARPASASRRAMIAIATVVVLAVGYGAWEGLRVRPQVFARPEGTLIAVFPPNSVGSDSLAGGGDELSQRLSAAIEGWSDVRIVPPSRVRDALAGSRLLTRDLVFDATRRLGVDRAVVSEIGRRADTIVLTTSLLNVQDGSSFRTRTAEFAAGTPNELHELQGLASALFRDGEESPWKFGVGGRRASLAAWTMYDSARARLREWALPEAERLLNRAIAVDPQFAQAQLRLAMVMRWRRDPRIQMTDAERAASRAADALREVLPSADSLLAHGLGQLAEGQAVEACRTLDAAVAMRRTFEGWFAVGDCRLADDGVIPNGQSPTRFVFRSGRWGAATAFEEALRTLSGVRPAFPHGRLQRTLVTEPNNVRLGRSADGRTFAAQVEAIGDSIGYWPRDVAANRGQAPGASPTALVALQRARARLRPLFVRWVQSGPRDWEAHDALAKLLEADGNFDVAAADTFTAIAEIKRAREVATGPATSDLIRTHVRLLLKSGRYSDARALVDSALKQWPKPDDFVAERLLGPAALIGNVGRTEALFEQLSGTPSRAIRDRTGKPIVLTPALLKERAAFYARAAKGLCDSTVRLAPERIADLVDAFAGSRERSGPLLHDLLVDPIMLALPCLGVEATMRLDEGRLTRVGVARALVSKDTARARRLLAAIVSARDSLPASFMSMDGVLADAWLALALRDTSTAERQLKRALTGLPDMFQAVVNRESIAASVPRAMLLYADISLARGHRDESDRWRAAARALSK